MNGMAMAGADFTAPAGVLTFMPGDVEEDIEVVIVNDGVEEMDETIMLSLDNAAGGVLGQREHTITISADILPRIGFTLADSMAPENSATQFVVQMDMASTRGPVSVDYTVSAPAVGFGATQGADYMLASGTITVPMGETMATLDLQEVNDDLDEYDEDLVVTLSNAVDVVIAQNGDVRAHRIEDNDALPSIGFAATDSSQDEDVSAGMLAVTLTPISGRDVTVNYALTGGSTEATDLVLVAGTLTIPAGAASANIPLNITDDTVDEIDETAIVTLSGEVNATAPSPAQHTLTIRDDDAPPTIQFQATTSTVGEGEVTHSVVAVLSAISERTIQFSFAANGTSTATAGGGSDYTFITGSPVMIAAGGNSAVIDLDINDDTQAEGDETIVLDMSGLTNATAGPNQSHTVTITDDDPVMPIVSWDPAEMNISALENSGQVTFHVVLSAASASTVMVNVGFAGSSANNPNDYTVEAGDNPVSFAPGSVSEVFRINITNNGSNESTENVVMTLSATPTGAIRGEPSVRTLTIIDND
jgi:hypothetical protein